MDCKEKAGNEKEIGWICQETTTVSREIGWKQNILDGNNTNNSNNVGSSTEVLIKDEKARNKISASDSSSNDSSSSSDSCDSKDEKRRAKKLRKEEKREKRREKRKLRKGEKMQKREMKKSKKEERRRLKKLKKLDKKSNDPKDGNPSDFSIPIDLMVAKARAPETPEEYAARQSRIRREVDPETGRYRLIKGDGEILEEIVSRERHLEINRQATKGDGDYFQAKTTGQK